MENEWGSRQQESMDDSSKTSRACHILRTNKGLMWPMGEAEEKMERGMWCKVLGAMPCRRPLLGTWNLVNSLVTFNKARE